MNPLLIVAKSTVNGIKSAVRREFYFHQTRPLTGTLFLTYRCTSRCATCTTWKRPTDKEKELNLADWKKIVDILHANGSRSIELFGGDVLLRKDILIPLIHHLKAKDLTVHMPTNTNLLDEKTAAELVKTQVDYIYLSTDGIGDTHDNIRGIKGTFNNVNRAISSLLKARGDCDRPRLICNTTVSKFNIDQLEEIASFAARMGFDENHIEYVGEMTQEDIDNSIIDGLKPTPYYVRQDESVLLSKEQAGILKEKLRKIKDHYLNKDLDILTINIDTLTEKNLYNGTILNKKCYVERTEVSIDPYGNVVACPFINNYFLGNILEEDFSKIWNNAAHLKFRHYQNSGKIALCNHCILGVQRNHSFSMALKRNLYYSHSWTKVFLSRFKNKNNGAN